MDRDSKNRKQAAKSLGKVLEKNVKIFATITNTLAKDKSINDEWRREFILRNKKPRPGRNPKTGEEIPITARRVVTFRPGQKLKARVEAYAGTIDN